MIILVRTLMKNSYINEEQLHPIGDSSERMIPVISNIVYKDILI